VTSALCGFHRSALGHLAEVCLDQRTVEEQLRLLRWSWLRLPQAGFQIDDPHIAVKPLDQIWSPRQWQIWML
jgi:hypothetical protein